MKETEHNTGSAGKRRVEKKRRRVFLAIFSIAIVAITSFVIITYFFPSETQQSTNPLSNEEVIKAVLEKEYNGPDMELSRLMNDWMNLQSETETNNQEEYDQLLESKEYRDFMNYYQTTFGEFFTDHMLQTAIGTNMVFKYNHYLIDNNIEMQLENVKMEQEKDHPTIYRPIIEVSLTNSQGQKVFHTLKEEFIFSTSEPGKIGRYNGVKDGGGMELQQKIAYFNAYVGTNKNTENK